MALTILDLLIPTPEGEWTPTGYVLHPDWQFVGNGVATLIEERTWNGHHIPSTAYYTGFVTDGVTEVPCIMELCWYGGPESGSYQVDFLRALPVIEKDE